MALNRATHYPSGRWANATTANPQGAFLNETSPDAGDRSYFEEDWINDICGFYGRILQQGGVTPNGSIDNANSSQVYTALINVINSVAGGVASVNNGTGINITGTAADPIINVNTSLTGMTINGVSLTTGAAATQYLDGTGNYSTPAGGGGSDGVVTSGSLVTNVIPNDTVRLVRSIPGDVDIDVTALLGGGPASAVSYDPNTLPSRLTATDVQAAIDEITGWGSGRLIHAWSAFTVDLFGNVTQWRTHNVSSISRISGQNGVFKLNYASILNQNGYPAPRYGVWGITDTRDDNDKGGTICANSDWETTMLNGSVNVRVNKDNGNPPNDGDLAEFNYFFVAVIGHQNP